MSELVEHTDAPVEGAAQFESSDATLNVRAEVALPATDVAVTTASGAGAPRYRATAGGWVIYDAGSGASVFTTR